MQQQVVKKKLSITQVELLLQGNSPCNFSSKDLSDLDLQSKEIKGAIFSSSDLVRTNFSDSQIAEVNFEYSNLRQALFKNSNINLVNFHYSKVPGTDFSNAIMHHANLTYISTTYYSSDENGPIFVNTDLTGSNLSNAKIPRANFSGSILTDANLESALLMNSTFKNAILKNADFTNANLEGTILTNANLAGANLSSASLVKSNCENADFTNANIVNVIFSGAKLTGAIFNGVIRRGFSSDFDQIRSASRSFRNLLKNPGLSTDQKKQMLEIDDANPNKAKLSEYLKERGKIIINDRRAGSNQKSEFQYFLEEVIRLEEELIPKVVQQPLIKQEPGEPLIVVKSEPQEPHRVVNKRQREEGSSAENGGMGSRQDIPQGAPIDNEALNAARILSSMRHNGRD